MSSESHPPYKIRWVKKEKKDATTFPKKATQHPPPLPETENKIKKYDIKSHATYSLTPNVVTAFYAILAECCFIRKNEKATVRCCTAAVVTAVGL